MPAEGFGDQQPVTVEWAQLDDADMVELGQVADTLSLADAVPRSESALAYLLTTAAR
jgi:hypothetical protein